MKCLRCNHETHERTQGKPLCRGCREAYKKERDMIRRSGLLTLVMVVVPIVFIRFKNLICDWVNSSRQFFAMRKR